MPVINRFDSGVVIGVDKHYLDPTQSTVILDADIEKFGMKSAMLPVDVGEAKRCFYEFEVPQSDPQDFKIVSSDTWRSYAEFQGKLAYSDGGPACQITDGALDANGEFTWDNVGVPKTGGTISAHVLTIDDIAGAKAVLTTQSTGGLINAAQIRYRLVDDKDSVYIGDIRDNTGKATVTFTLPSTVKVYREALDEHGGYTDKFVFVGSGNFVDGLVEIHTAYNFVSSTKIANFSSHRLSLVLGKAYSVPYSVKLTTVEARIDVPASYQLTDKDTWAKATLGISVAHASPPDDITAIASSFSYADKLYILVRIGSEVSIWLADGTNILTTTLVISDEFFKGTTIEWDSKLYMFSPSEGRVVIFDGTRLTIRNMLKFPYAKAEDSVYTIKGDTIYALLNDKHSASIRKIQLPALTVELTGNSKVSVEKIRGLGGSSGSVFVDSDFQVFPIHKGIVTYSRLSNQVIESDIKGADIPTNADFKGFTFHNTLVRAISHRAGTLATLHKWNVIQAHSPSLPAVFDIRTLTGTYNYNVAQLAAGGSAGSIMTTESNPVSVYKGHIKVDLSKVVHTKELRLYRAGGNLSEYFMVENVDPTNEYIDKRDDVTISVGQIGKYNFVDAPPAGLEGLTEHKGRLFGYVGDTIYWSQPGNADHWDRVKSFVVVDRKITGIASAVFGLVIFMKGRIKLLSGDLPTSFSMSTITNSKGTQDTRSIQAVSNGVLFFSEDGLCFTDGRQVVELSYNLLGSRKWEVIDSMTTSRSYYALCTNFMEGSKDPARVMMKYDIDAKPAFSFLSADNVKGLGYVQGKLHHSKGEVLFDTLGKGERILNYKSGNISEGAPALVKEWDRARMSGYFVGLFIVSIDDREVIREEIELALDKELNLHIPKGKNKGKSISFEAIGAGLITSIEYSITPRKTTK